VIKLVADVMARRGDRVLLVRYADPAKYDGEEGWFLPDDFLRRGEHPRDAAVRVLAEQVGLAAASAELDHIESFGGEGDEAWHLIFHFRAVAGAGELRPSPAVRAAEWFPLDALPPRGAVAHDGWALDLIGQMTKT